MCTYGSYYEKFSNEVIENIDGELPFNLPKTWCWTRLGDIGIWRAGSTPSRSHPEYYGGTIPWLKTGDLNDGFINSVSEYITQDGMNNSSVILNPIGSVLIAMYGATIGKVGIANIELTTNQACCACLPYNKIHNRFLYYFLISQRDNFISRGTGGAQSNISKEKLISTLFPLPPYLEQIRIVNCIDNLLSIINYIEKSLV